MLTTCTHILLPELELRSSAAEAMRMEVETANAERHKAIAEKEALEKSLQAKLAEVEAHVEKKLRTFLAALKS